LREYGGAIDEPDVETIVPLRLSPGDKLAAVALDFSPLTAVDVVGRSGKGLGGPGISNIPRNSA